MSDGAKIAVIGTGHIGHYMRMCYEPIAGNNLKDNVVLVKATKNGLTDLIKEFDCRIVVGNTLFALREIGAEVILVCTPPSQIPVVIDEALVPYCRERKALGAEKPDIYTFGPTPAVDYFTERLTDTANVVKILPNMFYKTKGVFSAFLETSLVTFSDKYPWPEKNKERLDRFLKPLVNYHVLSENDSVAVLGVKNAAHCLYDMCLLISDVLEENGNPGEHHQEASSVMRAALREKWDDMPEALIPFDRHALPSPADDFAANAVISWVNGLSDYFEHAGYAPVCAEIVRRFRVEAYLVTIGMSSREEVLANTRSHSTKGGLCERSGIFFREKCEQRMLEEFRKCCSGEDVSVDYWKQLRRLGEEAAETIVEHGKHLADRKVK